MRQPLFRAEQFVKWFHQAVPGAYRQITIQDIRDLTEVGLIGRYKYYGRQDIEITRAVLQYEKMKDERLAQSKKQPVCKMCGKPLSELHDKRGRPREHCTECEPFRARERYKKWHRKMSVAM